MAHLLAYFCLSLVIKGLSSLLHAHLLAYFFARDLTTATPITPTPTESNLHPSGWSGRASGALVWWGAALGTLSLARQVGRSYLLRLADVKQSPPFFGLKAMGGG